MLEYKQKTFLITRWGSIVCYDYQKKSMYHTPIENGIIPEAALDFYSSGCYLVSDIIYNDKYLIESDSSGKYFHLKSRDSYLTAHPDGKINSFQSIKNPWERFFIINEDDIKILSFILSTNWISKTDNSVIEKEKISLLKDFSFQIGDSIFHLSENFNTPYGNFDATYRGNGNQSRISEITLWIDKWKPFTFIAYRPLVYFCTFGEKSTETLNISLRSLKILGKYKGDVLIITDINQEDIKVLCPETEGINLHIWNIYNQYNLDFYSSRFKIFEWENIYNFSPIIYMDTDIVVDKPIDELLVKIFYENKMSAQIEAFTQRLSDSSVGGSLINADDRYKNSFCEESGFNSGLITIPKIEIFAPTMKKIYKCIYRYADENKSRTCLSHFDQAIANYINFVDNCFDLSFLKDRVNFFHYGAIRINDSVMSEREQKNYCGFVHFWGTVERVKDMNQYIDSVINKIDFIV